MAVTEIVRAATEGETLATSIRGRLGELTPTERRAAHVLLSNYPFAGLETVAQENKLDTFIRCAVIHDGIHCKYLGMPGKAQDQAKQ